MKLQVLCGMIASGKSTYVHNAASRGLIVVNDDAIVSAVHANNYNLYRKELKPLYKSIENQIAQTALAMQKSVIVDRGVNVSQQSRIRWVGMAKSLDVFCEAVVFPKHSAEEHASRRCASDSRGYDFRYWLWVAKAHESQYVEPSLAEGFDSVKKITWDQISAGEVL